MRTEIGDIFFLRCLQKRKSYTDTSVIQRYTLVVETNTLLDWNKFVLAKCQPYARNYLVKIGLGITRKDVYASSYSAIYCFAGLPPSGIIRKIQTIYLTVWRTIGQPDSYKPMCFEDISDNKSSMYRNKSVFIFSIVACFLCNINSLLHVEKNLFCINCHIDNHERSCIIRLYARLLLAPLWYRFSVC